MVLNNKSETIDKLISCLQNFGANLEIKNPGESIHPENYCGIVISGGFLPGNRYRELLVWYCNLLNMVQQPLLGVCLGLRIMGYCYGARIRKMEAEENGVVTVSFHKEYPLAPKRRELKVYETHLYELISTGRDLENYGSSNLCKIQAVKHKNKPQFGVQFHPEIDKEKNEGWIILENFVKLCMNKT